MLEEVRRFLPEGPAGAFFTDWIDRLVSERRRHWQDTLRSEHDLDTLLRIVGEIGERTLDAKRLQVYLLRMLMGRFLIWSVVIFRRNHEGGRLEVAASRGLGLHKERAQRGLAIPRESEFAERLVSERGVVSLSGADGGLASLPEGRLLREMGVETVLPLVVREGGLPGLEGLIGLGPRMGDRPFKKSDVRLLGMLAGIIAVSCQNEFLFRRSVVDDLTRVASRGHFDARLAAEISRSERYGKGGLALLMLDLDHFKRLNDRYGHQVGDVALRRVAALLRSCVRSSDLVARYGGEEFSVILVELRSLEDAIHIAERIRRTIGSSTVAEKDGSGVRITASLGVAHHPHCAGGAHELVGAADSALYRAKALGRDRVCFAEPRGREESEETGRPTERRSGCARRRADVRPAPPE
jgi:diguanylate cyclase (GGDEF)-like protein